MHNGTIFGFVPTGHSVYLQKLYYDIKMVLDSIKYLELNWIIYVDLKMVNFLVGQQKCFTKFSCYLCMWESRARNQRWIQKEYLIYNSIESEHFKYSNC